MAQSGRMFAAIDPVMSLDTTPKLCEVREPNDRQESASRDPTSGESLPGLVAGAGPSARLVLGSLPYAPKRSGGQFT